MDHSYPLTTYDSYSGNFQDIRRPLSVPHALGSNFAFSIPRKAIASGAGEESDHAALLNPPLRKDYSRTQPVSRSFKSSILLWWFPEIFASFLSVASLLSIAIVLRHYEGCGLNELNLPNALTLNGIVAAVATINRVALMVPVSSALSQEAWLWLSSPEQETLRRSRLADLDRSDAASRGAWGSLVFLFVARRRWLAYVGATVTIVSLAFGAFSQQLLAITEFPLTSKDANLQPGNIPRAETWQYYSGNPAEFLPSLPLPLKASVYNGILSDSIEPVIADCPTGNCTWPVTPSLAICGECVRSSFTKYCFDAPTSNSSAFTLCNYTMPSGSVATLIDTDGYNYDGPAFAVMHSTGAHFNTSLNNRLYITNFDVVGASYRSYGEDFISANASECAMWICVQAYNVSTQNNKQVQKIAEEYADIDASEPPGEYDDYRNSSFKDLPAAMNVLPGADYSIRWIGVSEFSGTLWSLFNGIANIADSGSEAETDVVDAIWAASANLDPWIKQVALSITNGLRNYTGPTYPNSPDSTVQPIHAIYNGTGYQLGVSVRWRWIILPAAMVLASLIFLFVVMIQTARSPVDAWKGSPLAFLFLDIDQEMKESAAGSTDRYHGLENAIGDTPIMLKGEPGGIWALKSF